MSVLNPRIIVNAVAAVVAAVGAALLVPAAYSLLTGSDDAWIFWLPGVAALTPGAVFFASRGPAAKRLRIETEHIPDGGRGLVERGAGW